MRPPIWLLWMCCGLLSACSGNLRDDEPGECRGDDCDHETSCTAETCSGTCVGDQCLPACSKGSAFCTDTCTDLRISATHCGECENRCQENEICEEGKCTIPSSCVGPNCECASGRDACDGVCVDTQSHPFHCGTCGTACHATEECTDGVCICPEGQHLCGETCVDPLTENKHCGTCGNVCVGGTSCEESVCSCPENQTLCNGICIDTSLSRIHCGTCGTECEGNDRCTLGVCDDSEDDCGGAAKDVNISRIALFQAVEIPLFENEALVPTPARNADIVIARDALVRVHVNVPAGFVKRELSARVFVDNLGEVELFHHKRRVTGSSTQFELGTTFNISLPAESIGADTKYRVELVECGDIPDGVDGTIRVPEVDSMALDARETGSVTVVLIPVKHDGRLPDTSPETMAAYAREIKRVFPVSGVELNLGESIDSHQTGVEVDLDLLLDDITTLRMTRTAPDHVYYYGLIDPAQTSSEYCEEGCTTGLGWISGGTGKWAKMHRAAVGVGFGTWGVETFSHELGHNHGRDHAPCGVEGDSEYPYENAKLGSWGYDYFSGSLRAPNQYVDLMSYCAPPWISDYNYQAILEEVALVHGSAHAEAFRIGENVTQTWARVLVTDKLIRWSQSFAAPGDPSEHPEPGIIYDAAGNTVAQVTVHRRKIADSDSYMLFVPPKEPGWTFLRLGDGTSIPY